MGEWVECPGTTNQVLAGLGGTFGLGQRMGCMYNVFTDIQSSRGFRLAPWDVAAVAAGSVQSLTCC